MRNKAPLALIELTVMVLIFALAAALCLQAFVWSDLTSSDMAERDGAVIQAESAAETVKACRGDFERAALILGGESREDGLDIYFDEEWQVSDVEHGSFCTSVTKCDSSQPLLGQAEVSVNDRDGTSLFFITVCWQEVSGDGR